MQRWQAILSHLPPPSPGIRALPLRAARQWNRAAGLADAEAPFAFSTAPGAGPGPVPAEPLTTNDASAGTRWPEIQAMFVDDLRASVQLTASLPDHSVDALVASLKEQQHSLLRAPGRAMIQEPRNCAPRSSSTAHSGTVSKISPVKLDHPLLGDCAGERLASMDA